MVDDAPIRAPAEALLGERCAESVAAELLERVAVVCRDDASSVQREACDPGAERCVEGCVIEQLEAELGEATRILMKEEGVLFDALVASGMPREGGPIAVMLHEHELGRRFVRSMKAAADSWAEGDAEAKEDLVQNAQGYVELLRQHIAKEDTILFQIAAQVLRPEEQDRVLAEFTRVEAQRTIPGTREKYEALAERLEDVVRQAVVHG